jgi:hypothetical protein
MKAALLSSFPSNAIEQPDSSKCGKRRIGLAKKDGAWKVTHEHFSVPFYMDGSNKAAIDLKP